MNLISRKITSFLIGEYRASESYLTKAGSEYSSFVKNKLYFNSFIEKINVPLCQDYGLYYNEGRFESLKVDKYSTPSYLSQLPDKKYFYKPVIGHKGEGAGFFQKNDNVIIINGKDESLESLEIALKNSSSNDPNGITLISEYLCPHDDIKKLSPKALPTFRILTFQEETNEINIVHAVLRMGLGDSYIDNFSNKGLG